HPWDAYTRTLPAGPWPRFAGRLLCGLVFSGLSLAPVLVIAAVATKATASPLGIALGAAAVAVGALPFIMLGLAIGYALPMKAALAVAQIAFFPLAFGGGLLSAPGHAPGFVEHLTP